MKHAYLIFPSITIMKSGIDLTFSMISLVITKPRIILIATLIKFSSSSAIFYRQLRGGKNQVKRVNHFHMIKFRTMVENADEKSGAVWAISNDNKLTTIGKFLRKARLAELPQFIKVIRGDRSLIGS